MLRQVRIPGTDVATGTSASDDELGDGHENGAVLVGDTPAVARKMPPALATFSLWLSR